MSLSAKELQEQYQKGSISKPQYIEQMHVIHTALFNYVELLKKSTVEKIEITDVGVEMIMRDSGLRILMNPQDHRLAPMESLNFGSYEEAETQMMFNLVSDCSTILDIGANIGWYSLLLSRRYPQLTIHAFEPITFTYDLLKKNIELNNSKTITAHPFGFSDKEQDCVFYFYPEGSGNASLANLSNRSTAIEVTSHVKCLDNFVSSSEISVDFIKCDVEGAELLVFKGAHKTLLKQKPIVFTEMLRKWAEKFDYHPNEIINLFRNLGYSCYTTKGGALVHFDLMNENTEETNFFFLHKEKHAEKIKQFSL